VIAAIDLDSEPILNVARRGVPSTPGSASPDADTLRHMLLDSLRRGHGKVAAQRYLMLTYIEVNVPP
jgi:hypothetical protein